MKDIYAKFVAAYMPLITFISCINVCFFHNIIIFNVM